MEIDFELVVRLSVALICGGLVGVEREKKGKAAGFRTHAIVSSGAALIMLISIYMFNEFKSQGAMVDPSRIAAQVITGIGFLGAGAIIRSGVTIAGLTTAATLWVCAAIGLAAGAGYYQGAIVTTALVMIILIILKPMEKKLFKSKRAQKKE